MFDNENFERVPSTWAASRNLVNEYFNFWPDGEDRTWAKTIWSAFEAGGLYSEGGEEGEQWSRTNIMALSLLYAESVVRLGFDARFPHPDRNWIIFGFGSFDNCEIRMIEVRNVLCFDPSTGWERPEKPFRSILSSVLIGSGTCMPGDVLDAYLDEAREHLPFMTCFREDRLFDLWNGAIINPGNLECLP